MEKYKYITIDNLVVGEYHIFNNKTNDALGEIKFDKRWKKWIVTFFLDAIFTAECLRDIAAFMQSLEEGGE